jgi:hypothetical protein
MIHYWLSTPAEEALGRFRPKKQINFLEEIVQYGVEVKPSTTPP